MKTPIELSNLVQLSSFLQCNLGDSITTIEELAQQAQKNYDNPEYDHSTKKWLTREEEMELEQLLGEGFDTWSKFDYSGFVQGCVTFGPSDYAHIAEAMGTKTAKEVEEYSKVFWSEGE